MCAGEFLSAVTRAATGEPTPRCLPLDALPSPRFLAAVPQLPDRFRDAYLEDTT